MKLLAPKDICSKNFELSDIFAMYQHWFKNETFTMETPRKSGAFLYFSACSGSYTTADNRVFNVPRGSLVYIPAGSTYKTAFNITPGSSKHTLLIEFNMKDKEGLFSFSRDPFIVKSAFILNHASMIIDIVEECTKPAYSPALIRSYLYRILYEISSLYKNELPQKYKHIEKGILYLESNTSSKINVEGIADMCHVSSGCFRRLFKEYSGMTPTEYHLTHQLSRAKKILLSSDISIENIAYSLGFADAAHFSKTFKKNYGITPGQYRKENKY